MSLRARTFLRRIRKSKWALSGLQGLPNILGAAGRRWLSKQLPMSFRILACGGLWACKGLQKEQASNIFPFRPPFCWHGFF